MGKAHGCYLENSGSIPAVRKNKIPFRVIEFEIKCDIHATTIDPECTLTTKSKSLLRTVWYGHEPADLAVWISIREPLG